MPEVLRNYVNGQWVECQSKKTFPNINPADTDEVVGLFQSSAAEDTLKACEAAAKAQPAWAALPAPLRGEFLFKAAEILESRLNKLGEDMTREEGKTLPEAKAEVKRAINIFRYFGGEGSRQFSYQIPSERENVFCYTMRKPLGVVALITPWNFPSAIPAWKMAPALVGGNTVVIKPASLAPLSAYRLVEALHETGIPVGAINYITGGGGAVGNTLVDYPAVRAVSFTGSCEVGNNLYDRVVKRKIRVQLEMGGKNPTIVTAKADLDEAAEGVMRSAFGYDGQKCSACSRVYVEKSVKKKFMDLLLDYTKARVKVGDRKSVV